MAVLKPCLHILSAGIKGVHHGLAGLHPLWCPFPLFSVEHMLLCFLSADVYQVLDNKAGLR